MNMKNHTISLLEKIRKTAPLVHNITNFVVMNSSANILLAIGASPVMAHSRSEVGDMTALAGALVLNIGTLEKEWVEAMIIAGQAANSKGIPVVLDPVGSGATPYRTRTVKTIMDECRISVLRGNASEIASLFSAHTKTKGVESSLSLSDAIITPARDLALEKKCVIAISGEEDCITDGKRVFRVNNGHPMMTRVTGTGCGLTAVTGAFCAVGDEDLALATAAAFGFYGLCGDQAILKEDKPGSFYVAFLDRLYSVGEADINNGLKMKEA